MAGPAGVGDGGQTNLLRYLAAREFHQLLTPCSLQGFLDAAHVRCVSGLALSTAYVSVFEKSSICSDSALNHRN